MFIGISHEQMKGEGFLRIPFKKNTDGKRLRIYTIVAFSFIRTFAP